MVFALSTRIYTKNGRQKKCNDSLTKHPILHVWFLWYGSAH